MDTTGHIPVTGGNVWYRRLGSGERLPLLLLHGGPGAASYYMEPLAERLAVHRPTEFDVIGRLHDWDRSADLHRIASPTLVTVGRYDELTPVCAQTIVEGVQQARLVVFESSAHIAHLEEGERYAEVVEAFLRESEPAL